MRFKEFYLIEASKEYNISKLLADKIIKLMKDIYRSSKDHPERYVNNSRKWIGLYKFPLSNFLKDLDVPDNGIFDTLKKGNLFLDEGHLEMGDKSPWMKVLTKNGIKRAGGYFSPDKENLGIHIPFIDLSTGMPFYGFFDYYHSVIIHELSHFIQEAKEKLKDGTINLSTDEWFRNEKEQEAYSNELYKDLQKYVSEFISDMKNHRSKEYKSPDYSSYVIYSNLLRRMFLSLDDFKKQIRMSVDKIFLDNPKAKIRFQTLQNEYRDIYNKFLEDSYNELKKEFKNIIPEKELKYK